MCDKIELSGRKDANKQIHFSDSIFSGARVDLFGR